MCSNQEHIYFDCRKQTAKYSNDNFIELWKVYLILIHVKISLRNVTSEADFDLYSFCNVIESGTFIKFIVTL